MNAAPPRGAIRRDPLEVAIDTRIVERDYQTRLHRHPVPGDQRRAPQAAGRDGRPAPARPARPPPSSSGCSRQDAITRVLFLVDRIPLAKQTEDAFAEHLPDFPAYVLRAGRRFQDEKRITITTLQSMMNLYADYSSGYFDLDHLRRVPPLHLRQVERRAEALRRHPDRPDRDAVRASAEVLADLEDDEDRAFVRDTLRFFEVDKPTFRYTLKEAIREGYLVPYQIYKAMTVKTAAEGGFPVARDELDWSAMDAATRAEFEALFGDQDTITVDPAALERRFTIPERNRAMVREFRDVVDNGYTGREGRPAQALDRQDHRVRGHQAPRRDAGPDVRRRFRRSRSRRPRSAMPTTSYPAWARTTPSTA